MTQVAKLVLAMVKFDKEPSDEALDGLAALISTCERAHDIFELCRCSNVDGAMDQAMILGEALSDLEQTASTTFNGSSTFKSFLDTLWNEDQMHILPSQSAKHMRDGRELSVPFPKFCRYLSLEGQCV